MQLNQINLSGRPIGENRAFLRALYGTEDLERAIKWFDKLDYSVSAARQDDPDMTLDTFLGLMKDSFYIVLQTGHPFPDEIRYCATGSDEHPVSRFVWVKCPYNEHNYGVISTLFKLAYGQEIESIPVPKTLRPS